LFKFKGYCCHEVTWVKKMYIYNQKQSGGEIVTEPLLMPGKPLRPDETSVTLNRPEPKVPGNKLDPEDPKSNCGIKELLTPV
jgi:hypothetical protein